MIATWVYAVLATAVTLLLSWSVAGFLAVLAVGIVAAPRAERHIARLIRRWLP